MPSICIQFSLLSEGDFFDKVKARHRLAQKKCHI